MPKVLSSMRLEPIISKVNGTIVKNSLISAGDRVVVALSGGPDSMAMLHILIGLYQDLDISLHIAHLDHQFRGLQSQKDSEFIRSYADRLCLPATIESIDVPSFARKNRLSAQAAAREIRYKFLFKVAGEVGGTKIALGHSSNDQAETVLARLLRGAGSRGLSGIPIYSRGMIIRPLLSVSRAEIIDYLNQSNIPFLSDPTNEKPIYLRNRIRHELLPLLAERYSPGIYDILNREAEILCGENEFLSKYSSGILDDIISDHGEWGLELDLGLFSKHHTAVKRRVILEAVRRVKGDIDNIGFVQIEETLRMADKGRTGAVMTFPGRVRIRRGYNRISVFLGGDLVQSARQSALCVGEEWNLALPVPGRVYLEPSITEIEASIVDGPCIYNAGDGKCASFDLELFSSPLTIRNRRRGDVLYPLGMGGKKKKLQDIFIDMKIPFEERGGIPLLVSPEGILWVMGVRQDDRFKVRDGTKRTLLVKILKGGD
ncbi:MAG TPA: tRNA lysidine(34) synthetase TilS [Nitrospiria bacterium]|nr:tRNA lysidine(34) synthetase TilS [Nitrospiria bacterium]